MSKETGDLKQSPSLDNLPIMASDMTLRDHFAGQALAGTMANEEILKIMVDKAGAEVKGHIAKYVYEIADAMIKERQENDKS